MIQLFLFSYFHRIFSYFHSSNLNMVVVTKNVNLFNCWHSYIFKGKLIKSIWRLWVLLFLWLFFSNSPAVQIFLKKKNKFFLPFLHILCIKKKHEYALLSSSKVYTITISIAFGRKELLLLVVLKRVKTEHISE